MSKDDDELREIAEQLLAAAGGLAATDKAKAMSMVPMTVPQMALVSATLSQSKVAAREMMQGFESDPSHPAYVLAQQHIKEMTEVEELMRKHGDMACEGHTPKSSGEVVQLRAVPKNNSDEGNEDDSQ